MNKYKIIAVCGQSGVGKSFLVDAFCYLNSKQVHKIVNTTTRPMREKEINGEDYWFVSDLVFKAGVISQDIIGWACFNNWYYGTSIEHLSTEKVNIGVFNPEAIRQLQKNENIDLTIFELYAYDKERLLRQLNRETNPNVEEIIRRYNTDKEDFKNLPNCHHLINENPKDLVTNIGIIQDYLK